MSSAFSVLREKLGIEDAKIQRFQGKGKKLMSYNTTVKETSIPEPIL